MLISSFVKELEVVMLFKRDLIIDKLLNSIDTPLIKVITGIRRCGKSYVLKLLMNEIKEKKGDSCNIIYMDFDSLQFEQYKDYNSLYAFMMSKINKDKKTYILLDEIQEVSGWENAVRSFLVDIDCDIYITGSNANLLSGELSTYLTGRYVEYSLYPLSFKEYIDFNHIKENYEDNFIEYLKYGGFPALHAMPKDDDIKIQYLKGIYNSVILRDVVERNNIRDVELLERILRYIMDNIGQIFSAKRIADYLKSQGRKLGIESVYNYIRALESAMIIYAAKRYDVKGKKILDRMEKYFLCDLGLRYGTIGYRENDISQVLENAIYIELLRRGYSVMVGKEEDSEIDFIAMKNNKKLYIQVTYLLSTNEVVEREYVPLKRIKDSFPKLVLSMDKYPIGATEGIKWSNIIDFLLEE